MFAHAISMRATTAANRITSGWAYCPRSSDTPRPAGNRRRAGPSFRPGTAGGDEVSITHRRCAAVNALSRATTDSCAGTRCISSM